MKQKLLLILIAFVFLPSPCFAITTFTYEGFVDLQQKQAQISIVTAQKGAMDVSYQKSDDQVYNLNINLKQLKTPYFDYSGEWQGQAIALLNQDNVRIYSGRVNSKDSLLNYKPVDELTGSFSFEDNKLHLKSFAAGYLRINGYVDFANSLNMDMLIDIKGMPLPDFIKIWVRESTLESYGEVTGEIDLSGTWRNPYLKGKLSSSNGKFGKLLFDNLLLKAEGMYPHINISNSDFLKKDGLSYSYEGKIDLSDLKNFTNQIKKLKVTSMVEETDSETVWTLKKNKSEGSTTEIKYELRDTDRFDPGAEGSGMLGIEQKMKF